MIKAVIFDLDNTLIDFMRIKKSSVEAAVTAMVAAGLRIGKEEAYAVMFELYDQYGIEYQEIFQKFLERVHKKVDYRILAAGIVAYRKLQTGLVEPYPNVMPALLRLRERGLKLAILTDAPRLKAWIRLTELRIPDFFDVVVTFDDTKEYKPGKMPFTQVLRDLKMSPDECLMVGDSVRRDIEGARAMGIITVFARYGATKDFSSSGADFEISSIDGLTGIVDSLNANAAGRKNA